MSRKSRREAENVEYARRVAEEEEPERCALCERRLSSVSKHHLVPVTRHSTIRNRSRELSHDDLHSVVHLCRDCHDNIHAVLSEKELEREYDTIEKLRAHPEIRRFSEWVADKREGATPRPAKRSRRRKGR